jgi:hypothetical protein
MKGSEEYLKELVTEKNAKEWGFSTLDEFWNSNENKETFEITFKAIRKAQIDAIEYTVKRCSEEAELGFIQNFNEVNTSDFHQDPDEGYYIVVDSKSILDTGNKIKEEINNGK